MLLFDLLMHSHKLKKEQTGLIFSHQSLTQFTSYEKRKVGVLIVEVGYWSVFTPLFDVIKSVMTQATHGLSKPP